MRVEAEVLGYNKKWVWLRIPHNEGRTHLGLTMPRDFLPWGMATADWVVLEYDPESLHHNGHGYVIDGEIVEMFDDRTVDTAEGAS